MRIIDAHWELRNLNVTCQEVIIESQDSEINKLNDLTASYQVVKLPIYMNKFIEQITNFGFSFIEQTYDSFHHLTDVNLPPLFERLKNSFSFHKSSSSEYHIIINEIKKGLFSTDRISIDPNFGILKGNQRYVGWIEDSLFNGANIYSIYYKNVLIGFFVNKKDPTNINHGILGGIFQQHKIMGAGLFLNFLQIENSRLLKSSSLSAPFSSNNIPVFKINQILGFDIIPKEYVFIRHKLK